MVAVVLVKEFRVMLPLSQDGRSPAIYKSVAFFNLHRRSMHSSDPSIGGGRSIESPLVDYL
jgi:hypothetical protein